MQQMRGVRGSGPSLCGGTGQHTGVSVYMCSSLQFLPQVITINDSVLLVNQPG